MSEIKTKEKLVGQLSAVTLNATAIVPEWLQPLVKENGVYVGTEPPTDPEKLVWINPDGQASDLDLSNYYTKDETDSLIDTAVQNIDLSSYATKVELENYDTSEQVDAKINAIEIPDVSRFITEIPSEYVTESELAAKGYAKTTDIPDVSGFALKSEIPSVEGLATETYVNEKIAAIPEVDLSGYALKTEIPDVSGFITSIPEEYVTETELSAKGYLTEHQDLSGYALKTEIPDVSAFQTEEQVNALINTALGVIENGTY